MIISKYSSTQTAKEKGSLMVEFDGRYKFDKDKKYRFFAYYLNSNELKFEMDISFNEIKEKYSLDIWEFEKLTYEDLLKIAVNVNIYYLYKQKLNNEH